MKRKIWAWVVVGTFLCASLLSGAAMADEPEPLEEPQPEIVLSAAPTVGNKDEIITVTWQLTESDWLRIANGQFVVFYDTEKLQYLDFQSGTALSGCMAMDNDQGKSGIKVGFVTSGSIANTGTFMSFRFTVLTDEVCTTELSLVFQEWTDGETEINYAKGDYQTCMSVSTGTVWLNPVSLLWTSPREGIVGQTVEQDLSLTVCPSVTAVAATATVAYDAEQVEPIGVIGTNDWSAESGTLTITAPAMAWTEGIIVTWKILPGLFAGTSPLSVTAVHWTAGAETQWTAIKPAATEMSWKRLAGDGDGDGDLSLTDVRTALAIVVHRLTWEEAHVREVDLDGDGVMTTTDALRIWQLILTR